MTAPTNGKLARGGGAQKATSLDQTTELPYDVRQKPPTAKSYQGEYHACKLAFYSGPPLGLHTQDKGQAMSKKPPVHTVPHEGEWANRREGSERVSKKYATKKEAEEAGRTIARREGTEHLIHKKDGKIGQRNSYGNDPHPPKG